MTTLQFPAGVDSFDIKTPQEIIKADHMNAVQQSIVAIEVYVLSLGQSLNAHLTQGVNVHPAAAISVNSDVALTGGFFPITATEVQAALEQLKAALEQLEVLKTNTVDFLAHVNTDINTAHPGLVLGSKIAPGAIAQSQLSFSVATYGVTSTPQDLAWHEAQDKHTAHPGLLTDADIALHTITADRLVDTYTLESDFTNHTSDIAPLPSHKASAISVNPTVDGYSDVQSALSGIYNTELNHINSSMGVHGIQAGSSVVGTLDTQRLLQKTLVSDFVGSKILLFTDIVETLEQQIFAPLTGGSGDQQIQVRYPSGSRTTNLSTTSLNTTQVVPVVTPSRFTLGDNVRVLLGPSYTSSVTGSITNISGSNITILFGSAVSITPNSFVQDTSIPNPIFSIDPNGTVSIYKLNVTNAAAANTTFDDNVVIDGTLTVLGATSLAALSLSGALSSTSSGSFGTSLSVGTALTAGSVTSSGNIAGSGNLSVSGTSSLTGNVTVQNSIISHGSLSVDGYGTFGGSVTGTSFTASTGVFTGVNVPQLSVNFDHHITSANATFTAQPDGYRHHTDDLAYSSTRLIYPDLSTTGTGVLEVLRLQVAYQIGDGYIQVDRVGTLQVGDSIFIGDSVYGYGPAVVPPFYSSHGRTIVGIDLNFLPPRITLDSFTNLELLSPTQDARVVKKIAYNSNLNNSLTDTIDTIAQDLHDHITSGLPYPGHFASQITTQAFGFSSINYTPVLNDFGAASTQAVLNEFGIDLYHHLDGYDGYHYPHTANDISFSNTFAHMGRKISLTAQGNAGDQAVQVIDSSHVRMGDTIEVHSSGFPPFVAPESHVAAIDGYQISGTWYVEFTSPLVNTFPIIDGYDSYLLDFNLNTVQDALEALSSNYDITNHIEDAYGAHPAQAITFNDAYNGFFATNVQDAIVALAGPAWNEATDPSFKTHLVHSRLTDGYIAHDGYAIGFDNTVAGLLGTPNNVQAAIDSLKALVDFDFNTETAALNAHIIDGYDSHAASSILVVPFNNMVSTDVQGALQEWNHPGDLVETSFAMANNQASPANVTGLLFDPLTVRSAIVHYSIYRYYTAPPSTTEIATVGTLRLVYKTVAGTWAMDDTYAGDVSGITFSVLPSGQVQYTSTNILGTFQQNILHFRAKVTGV